MKVTTTIMDIIQSELQKEGYNEFSSGNELSFFNKEHSFIHKVMRMDNAVKPIIDDMFFQGLTLNNNDSDILFKQAFINRFLNRQIAFQTVEAFSSQVVYTFLSMYDYINYLYDEIDDFIKGKNVTISTEKGSNISDFRQLLATLPQNTVNMSLDNPVMNYADENTINKNRNTREGNTENTSKSHNINHLLKLKELFDDVFNTFDKKCFLQVW